MLRPQVLLSGQKQAGFATGTVTCILLYTRWYQSVDIFTGPLAIATALQNALSGLNIELLQLSKLYFQAPWRDDFEFMS